MARPDHDNAPRRPWRPATEEEATSALACFIEWARAGGTRPGTDPDDVTRWANEVDSDFDRAIAAFAGIEPGALPATILRRQGGTLIDYRSGQRRLWRFVVPPDIIRGIDAVTGPRLATLLADHLLIANTRPDDRLLWVGPAEEWPLGVLLVGATLVLVDDAAEAGRVAAAERAVPLRPRLSIRERR